jgi:hypothetical protein
MPGLRWRGAIAAAALGLAIGGQSPVAANPGDKAGWTFQTDQQRRALLIYVPAKDATRYLTFACHRSAETFELLVEDVGNASTAVTAVPMALTNGKARYEAKGEIGYFAATKSFDSNMIVDATALRRIRDTLVPVLEGPGPVVLTLGSLKREMPVAGLADPLRRFVAACFDSRAEPEAATPTHRRPLRRHRARPN